MEVVRTHVYESVRAKVLPCCGMTVIRLLLAVDPACYPTDLARQGVPTGVTVASLFLLGTEDCSTRRKQGLVLYTWSEAHDIDHHEAATS